MEEAYFFPLARQLRDALSIPLILLGGITRLATMTQAIRDGFAFVPLGRALREPDPVARLGRNESPESLGIHCNRCRPAIYRGTHCVLVPLADRPGLRMLPLGIGPLRLASGSYVESTANFGIKNGMSF